MIEITVDKAKLNALSNNFDKLINSMDFKKPLKESAGLMMEEQQANFGQQGRLYGTWAPLAASTRRDRVYNGYSAARPILVRTGKLMKGFVMRNLTSKSVAIANLVDYAIYHQDGTTRMPARKIIGITRNMKGAIARVFAKYITDSIRSSFG